MLMSDTEERKLSRVMVKARVLSLQSRGRNSDTGRTRRAAYSLTRRSRHGKRYGESGLHAADRRSVREQCGGLDRWDAPRCGDLDEGPSQPLYDRLGLG